MLPQSEWASFIKRRAAELGFMACGISKAEFLEEEAPRLETWLTRRMNGKMGYMENHFDKRLDPRLLVDGAKSVISLCSTTTPRRRTSNPTTPSKSASTPTAATTTSSSKTS